ncbi:MAG: LytTR family DNA-binding domain-containing protein [Lachnospiraceae bacterium]|nr:LytTR family DNA-binding domain-containing protein [Lachnospiraceae bacterium]
MRIRMEVEEDIEEDEVVIRCGRWTEEMQAVQQAVYQAVSQRKTFVFYKGDAEYYLGLEQILFFETDGNGVSAHTISDVYQTNSKLYELEEVLPSNFMRISKSTILNVNRVYAMTRNLTASSLIEFQNTHKQVYVSRNYYKALKCRLEEKRK